MISRVRQENKRYIIFVKACIMQGEIIEDYPDDFPYSSRLIFGYTVHNKVIHTVVSLDIDSGFIGIITAYYSNIPKFKSDRKTRREC